MSGWWWLIGPVVVAIVWGFIGGAVKAHRESEAWVDEVNADAVAKGLPPMTHRKRHWIWAEGVMCVDPKTGKWLWRAEKR